MSETLHKRLPQSVLHPYTGGHSVVRSGYVYELCPDHPKANPFGFVPQHRLVVERQLGRYLLSSEQVHHADMNPLNNSPENLQLLSRKEHMAIHRKIEREAKYPPLSRQIVSDALADGGLKAAAKALGCSMETIRNNFPDLVEPYKRKSPANLYLDTWVDRVKPLAADDKIGYREAAAALGISIESIMRVCQRNNIPWVRKSKVGEIHSKYTYRNRKPSQKK